MVAPLKIVCVLSDTLINLTFKKYNIFLYYNDIAQSKTSQYTIW